LTVEPSSSNAEGTTDDKKSERFFLVVWQNKSILKALLHNRAVGVKGVKMLTEFHSC